TVPAGSRPDMGAYEYGGSPAATATPTGVPTSQPTSVAPTATPVVDGLVIDDQDPGFSTTSAQDAWVPYAQAEGEHYGGSHWFNRTVGAGDDIATWTFQVPEPGVYEVFAWWWAGATRPPDVPYTIECLTGNVLVRMNQQIDGGRWNSLGEFSFRDVGRVRVSDGATSGLDVVADAVRLVYLRPLSDPQPGGAGIVVDDRDEGFALVSGSGWAEYDEVGGQSYGSGHRYQREVGSGTSSATWTFSVPEEGNYRVYAWWSAGIWRPADVPYTVQHQDGETTVRVNQQTDGGRWNCLGSFRFVEEGAVTVSDSVASGRDIVADAIWVLRDYPHKLYLPALLKQ
ncbi:MAG: golvesin C-terminal-like domain-containing protein, partial [Anaerolineae bacterium]